MFGAKKILSVCLLFLISIIISCGSKTVYDNENDEVLVCVGDSALTISQVIRQIPSGLAAQDSINLFNRIVEDWVSDLVLVEFAEDNITDMQRIDRMVESYRKDLIINEYIQKMMEVSKKEIPEKELKAYYDNNQGTMTLEQPLVKGIFIKISENDEALADLRKWMEKFDGTSIDNIEKSGFRNAKQYKYFKDDWIEWNAVADLIPYRFNNADDFLNSHKYFETNDKGTIYMLRISDHIGSGSVIPYEYAKLKIADILQSDDMDSYRTKLISEIYKSQIKNGKLKPGLYDPVKGMIKK